MFFGKKTRVDRGNARAAEHFVVSATDGHLRIDFLVERSDESFAGVRLLLTKAFAKRACTALETTVQKYQTAHGHIRVAREAAPTNPRFTALEERAVNHMKLSYADDAFFFELGLVLNTPQESTDFDRLVVVTPVGLGPPLLSAIQAALKG